MSLLTAVVLAAGEGKRMKSALSKVLHPVAGRPLVHYPVKAALDAGATRVVLVVSPQNREDVESYVVRCFGRETVKTALQEQQRGTGDAARAGLERVETERVLLLYGDTPLIRGEELERIVAGLGAEPGGSAELALLSCVVDEPAGYGRVMRDAQGRVVAIREQRDLRSDEERAIHEVNAGVYAASTAWLKAALGELRPDNAQGEYYLTDVVALAAPRARAVALQGDPEALVGVNDRAQLADAERLMFRRIARRHALAGVTVRGDGPRIDDAVSIEPDVTIEANACLRGTTHVARGATIEAGCVVTDSQIGENAVLKPYSVVTASRVGPWAQIGPFAHLRPETEIEEKAHVGNFVETKKTRMRRGAKANHLAYLGDGDIGEGANIGAGTIFCNYDGFQKHQTVVGAGAFIGSDSQIVAPVRIGQGAYVATGTTVTRDVPDEALAISRVKQETKEGYAPRLKSRLQAAARNKRG